MKKFTMVMFFALTMTGAVSAQMTDVSLLNVRDYAEYFGFKNGEITVTSKYIYTAPRDLRETIGPLDGRPIVDTPLEFALLSYYSESVINIRPIKADTVLPANDPKQADLKLGAAVFQEIQVLRFLGNTAAAVKHEAALQFITGRGHATRAEIEAFYRNGIPSLVSSAVDKTLIAGKSVNNDTRRVIDQIITTPIINYYLTPNNSNFDEIKRIEKVLNEINSLDTSSLDTQTYRRISDAQGSTQAGSIARLIAAGLLDIEELIRNAEVFDKLGSRLAAQIARQAVNELRNIQSRIISREFRINNAGNVEWGKIDMYKAVYSLNAELAIRLSK